MSRNRERMDERMDRRMEGDRDLVSFDSGSQSPSAISAHSRCSGKSLVHEGRDLCLALGQRLARSSSVMLNE